MLQLARVDGRLIAAPPTPLDCYLPAGDALAGSTVTAGRVRVRVHRQEDTFDDRLLIAGRDPAMSILARHLQRHRVQAVLVHQNSSNSLSLLKQGRVHIAGTHLRGESAITSRFSRTAVAVVSFATWQEGLVTAAGNPKRIKSIEDLTRKGIRFVNREVGAGTRQLLDDMLAGLHIRGSQVRGYNREAPSHLAGASEVKTGTADCCIATEAAARVFGLTFIPLQTARYDLVFRRAHQELPTVRALLDAIVESNFRRELSAAAAYDTGVTGARVL